MQTLHFFSAPPFVAFLALALFFSPAKIQARGQPRITGKTVLADGTTVVGATVETTQDCDHGGDAIETHKTVSAPDGTFSLSAYDPNCSRYRLIASKETDFWLPSDDLTNSKFGLTINERIVVDVSSASTSKPIVIVLKSRGGKVAIRVRDLATGRFVFADLWYQKPDQNNLVGALIPTALDGSADTHLLTPGEYTVQVGSFTCGNSHSEAYLTADGPKISLIVRPAVKVNKIIEIDSRTVQVLKHDGGKFGPDSISPNCNLRSPRRPASGLARSIKSR
jgi:hypothetical protein